MTKSSGFAIGLVVLAGLGSPALSAGEPTSLDASPRPLSAPAIEIDARGATPRAIERDRRVSGNPLWAIPLSSLSATRERPIFRQSRRPPAPAVIGRSHVEPQRPAAPPESQTPQLTLVGAVVGEADGIAIFLDQANKNAVVRLRMGEAHDGWVLHALKGREAILQRDSETLVFALPALDSVSAPAAPTMHGSIVDGPAAPAPVGSSGALVLPPSPNEFAPFVPRSTPANGESDGL